jgi:hypothetical protein
MKVAMLSWQILLKHLAIRVEMVELLECSSRPDVLRANASIRKLTALFFPVRRITIATGDRYINPINILTKTPAAMTVLDSARG